MKENSIYDKKSLRTVWGKKADFNELAKDCVAFSNAEGGYIDIGIEDGQDMPPEEYRVNPDILRRSDYKGKTSLKRIEDYRIKELIKEDMRIYKKASATEIQKRIGEEIPSKKIWKQLQVLVEDGYIRKLGSNRWIKYELVE